MDKSSKLQRYSRKDYSQQVAFPVEIVGRDGLVRRYSFQSSVRLYQRRIASAPGRYSDPDLVRAEVTHCRQRIRQLRQSYYRRYGASDLAVGAQETGEFAGELAAFLRRCFGDLRLELLPVETLDEQQTWYFAHPESGIPYLLSLYRFQHYGPCEARESFFRDLRVLRSNHGLEVETLVAFHHTGDCGLVLSCTGEHADAPLGEDHDGAAEEPINPAWSAGLQAIAQADLEQALGHLEQAQMHSPYSRKVAVACAMVAGMLRHHERAETAAHIGLGALPQDETLRYLLALSLFRQGRFEAAGQHLDRMGDAPRLPQQRLLRGVLALRVGRLLQAERLFREAQQAPRMSELRPQVRGLRARVWSLLGFGGLAVASILAAGLAMLLQAPAPQTLALLGVVLSGVAVFVTLVSLSRRLAPARLTRLRLPPAEAIGARGPELDELTDS